MRRTRPIQGRRGTRTEPSETTLAVRAARSNVSTLWNIFVNADGGEITSQARSADGCCDHLPRWPEPACQKMVVCWMGPAVKCGRTIRQNG